LRPTLCDPPAGIVVLTLFGISNPTLHLAKLCNQLDIGILRVPTFALFAGLFFMTRVVLVPLIILIPGMFHSRQWVPYAVRDFHAAYVALNFMMTVMYALQLVWMRSILRVLRQAATAGADAASQLSAQVDPAKRYVAVHKEN